MCVHGAATIASGRGALTVQYSTASFLSPPRLQRRAGREREKRMMTRRHAGVIAVAGLVALLYGGSPASAQTVGAASSFAIVGGTTVTAGGATSDRSTATSASRPGTSITGFPLRQATVPPMQRPQQRRRGDQRAGRDAGALQLARGARDPRRRSVPQLNGTDRGPGIYSIGAADLAARRNTHAHRCRHLRFSGRELARRERRLSGPAHRRRQRVQRVLAGHVSRHAERRQLSPGTWSHRPT